VRTAGVSADQTELTLAADHARWLRDKQSDVYVAMIRFVQDATMHRADVIRYIEHNLDLPEEIHEAIASYEGQPLRDLLVMAQAYASRKLVTPSDRRLRPTWRYGTDSRRRWSPPDRWSSQRT